MTAFSCAPATTPTNATSFNCSVTFSEAPGTNPFSSTTADVTVGGTSSVWTKGASSGSGAGGYTFTVSRGGPNTDGSLTIQVAAGAINDAAGNNSAASSIVTYTIDTIAPSVTINEAVGQADPTVIGPIYFTAVFSEPVTGFASTDVSSWAAPPAGRS